MKNYIKKSINFIRGLLILLLIYYFSMFVVNITHINIPPVILGLILFTVFLQLNIIKESYIKTAVDFLLKNITLFLVPFIVGLIPYKEIFTKNLVVILLILFISTTLVLVTVGLFVDYGLKLLRLNNIRKAKNE